MAKKICTKCGQETNCYVEDLQMCKLCAVIEEEQKEKRTKDVCHICRFRETLKKPDWCCEVCFNKMGFSTDNVEY